MAITPNSVEFYTIFWLTMFVVIVKAVVLIYLEKKIQKKKKEGSMAVSFIRGISIFILSLLVARIFYIVFDFHYTKFDDTIYYLMPQIWYWKAGQLLSGLGQVYLVWVVDKKILDNKFKGVISILMLVLIVFPFLYPVRQDPVLGEVDFNLLSTFSIVSSLGTVIVFLVFIYIGRKSTGAVKKTAYTLSWAFFLYGIGALAVNQSIIDALQPLFSGDIDVYVYLVQSITKAVAICLIAYGATKFAA